MPPQKNNNVIWILFILLFVLVLGGFGFMQYQIMGLKGLQNVAPTFVPSQLTTSTCGTDCQAFINQAIESQLKIATSASTPTGTKMQIIYNQAPASPKITYIPLSGGSTQNTDWTDITGSTFTMSIGDYGTNASATWDANLRVDNASGATYARIFDKTHGIAVNGSEINVVSSSTSTDVFSSALQFWSGNNTYVIQLKSLNGSTAFLDSGRIRIAY